MEFEPMNSALYRLSYEASPKAGQVRVEFLPVGENDVKFI